MTELVFCLEEVSAKAMLEGILPRLFPSGGLVFRYMVFEGKQDLEKQLPRKLKGYRNQNARFLVLRDQDSNPNCADVKKRLRALCDHAGKPDALVRIACRELESFYMADLAAVELGLGLHGLVQLQSTRKFRSPDYLGSPSKELSTLTKGKYQKVGGSRSIGVHLQLDNCRSDSFRNLVAGIKRIATQ